MIIVIGGSLGGTEALRTILTRLPREFSVPIAVALHRHPDSGDLLAPILQKGCALTVKEAEDKIPFAAGGVYLAPPDYHLLVDGDRLALSLDEPVNFARPSIDVLFESAAEWKGHEVVAVVLTGSGSDGAAGAQRISQQGGTILVQDPVSAEGPWMPLAAMDASKPPQAYSLEQIADRLIAMAAEQR